MRYLFSVLIIFFGIGSRAFPQPVFIGHISVGPGDSQLGYNPMNDIGSVSASPTNFFFVQGGGLAVLDQARSIKIFDAESLAFRRAVPLDPKYSFQRIYPVLQDKSGFFFAGDPPSYFLDSDLHLVRSVSSSTVFGEYLREGFLWHYDPNGKLIGVDSQGSLVAG
jgi:hypothetical protein